MINVGSGVNTKEGNWIYLKDTIISQCDVGPKRMICDRHISHLHGASKKLLEDNDFVMEHPLKNATGQTQGADLRGKGG